MEPSAKPFRDSDKGEPPNSRGMVVLGKGPDGWLTDGWLADGWLTDGWLTEKVPTQKCARKKVSSRPPSARAATAASAQQLNGSAEKNLRFEGPKWVFSLVKYVK